MFNELSIHFGTIRIGESESAVWARISTALGTFPRVPGDGDPKTWTPAQELGVRAALVGELDGVTLVATAHQEGSGLTGHGQPYWFFGVTAHLPQPLGLGMELDGMMWRAEDAQRAASVLAHRDGAGFALHDHLRLVMSRFAGRRASFSGNDRTLTFEVRPTFQSILSGVHALDGAGIQVAGLALANMANLLRQGLTRAPWPPALEARRQPWRAFAEKRGFTFCEPFSIRGEHDAFSIEIAMGSASAPSTSVTIQPLDRSPFGGDDIDAFEAGKDLSPALERLLGPQRQPAAKWVHPPAKITAYGGARELSASAKKLRHFERGVADPDRLAEILDSVLEIGAALSDHDTGASGGPYR